MNIESIDLNVDNNIPEYLSAHCGVEEGEFFGLQPRRRGPGLTPHFLSVDGVSAMNCVPGTAISQSIDGG